MIITVGGITPKIGKNVFIAPGAVVAGDVTLGDNVSVWFNASIRGDMAPIEVGEGSNIQEAAVLHVDNETPCRVGKGVTIGHGAVVHGCTVGDNCLIGMNSTVLNRSRVGDNSIVGANALVTEGKAFEGNTLIVGMPAKAVRTLDKEAQENIRKNAEEYRKLGALYLNESQEEGT